MKAKAVAASDKGLDTASRTALQNDFNALRDQITTIVNNATFNGTNMLKNAARACRLIVSSDGTSTISVAAADLSLTGSTITLTAGSTFTSATQAASVVTKLIDTRSPM